MTITFVAAVGLTYALVEATDSDGEVLSNATYSYVPDVPGAVDDTAVAQINAAGFVTPGGTTMAGPSFTALKNGTCKITAKGEDAAADEVDAELDLTVSTVEAGTISVGAGTP